jgi:predicted transcriptional regulator
MSTKAKEPINITEIVVNTNIMTVQSIIDRLQSMEYMHEKDADTVLDLVDVQSTLAGFSQFIRAANNSLAKQQKTITSLYEQLTTIKAQQDAQ